MMATDDEVREVARLAWRFCRLDERRRAGSVLLTDVAGVRSWVMGHPTGVISLAASAATGDGDWILPKRLIHAAAVLADGDVTFHESTVDGDTQLTIASGESAAMLPLVHAPEQVLIDWARAERQVVASVTLPVTELARLVAAARFTPHDLGEDESPPLFWITVAEGLLMISIDWGPFGVSRFSARGTGRGEASAAANPVQLGDVLEVFDDDVTIEMTGDPDDVIILRADDRRALVTPIETTHERLRGAVEAVLAQAFGDVVLRRDDDGDYPIRRHGAPIYARLIDDRPVRLHVFAILLDGVEETPDLFRELNDLNVAVRFARLTWASGRVYAEVDLVAESLDVDELLVAVQRIEGVSNELIPTIGAFFGGTQPDALASRWDLYRRTVVEAEVTPERWQALNGPESAEEWLLPDEVFVITACNPAGAVASDEANAAANNELAYDLRHVGGNTITAIGRAVDGEHAEPGVLMWGLPLDAALFYGRKYHQDAVFRLTAADMELISCVDDRRETWPRRSLPTG